MAKFESQERRMPKIEACLKANGLESLDACREMLLSKGIDVDAIVKGVQPICFENAVWAYTLGTAIAVYAAWRSYQPIRKLYAKYGGSQKPSNELQTLEELLSNSLKRNSFSQKQIEEQMEQLDLQQSWLKQQLVMMLITGNDSPVVKELIQKMGFEMSHAHFALCFLYLQGDEGDRTGLVRSIEDFSDEECTLYAAELQENREYIVLMNFQEEEQCRELLELLSDSLESRNLSVRVQWSRTCSQLNEIASAAIETLNTPPVALAVDNAEAEEEENEIQQQPR